MTRSESSGPPAAQGITAQDIERGAQHGFMLEPLPYDNDGKVRIEMRVRKWRRREVVLDWVRHPRRRWELCQLKRKVRRFWREQVR